jgi:prevent-host-death family protein
MKSIAAGVFKAKCLSLMDEVKNKRQPLLITKHGKPVAKLVPVEDTETDPIFGFYKGKITVTGDVVAPAFSPEDWGDLY